MKVISSRACLASGCSQPRILRRLRPVDSDWTHINLPQPHIGRVATLLGFENRRNDGQAADESILSRQTEGPMRDWQGSILVLVPDAADQRDVSSNSAAILRTARAWSGGWLAKPNCCLISLRDLTGENYSYGPAIVKPDIRCLMPTTSASHSSGRARDLVSSSNNT